MKKVLFGIFAILIFASCERVAPNYYGVLMEDYGKSKSNFSIEKGRVNTMGPGTELFQVPAWEQRATFTEDGKDDQKILHLKSADNTEFTAKPVYSYKAIENRVIDLVFQNARLGSGNDFMRALEDNVLEPRIYDIIKEESRKYNTDTLMAQGGSLLFEQRVQQVIKESFASAGLELISFSSNMDFSNKVKEKIDTRNEVNTNISVLDQQILEQRKRNELALLKAEENRIISSGLTDQLLKKQFIETWGGKTPLYGNTAPVLFKNIP
jgi:hypothetical protein